MADLTCRIIRDPENKKLIIEVVDRSDPPAQQAAKGIIELNLEHVLGKYIKARETQSCDDEGNPVYAMILRSEWYDTPVGDDFT